MSVAAMRMLRWMSEDTKKDKIRNKYVKDSRGFTSLVDKLHENRLRQVEHVLRRQMDEVVKIVVKGKRGEGD